MTNRQTKRPKKRLARLWSTVSHHPLWSALVASLLAAAIIAHAGGIFSSSENTATISPRQSASKTPLRIAFHQVSAELFSVAFDHYIAVPRPSESWEALHARGGVDVGGSDLRLVFANHSDAALTITNVEAVVRRIQPAPKSSLAYVYTQGAETLEGFSVALESEVIGATGQFHSFAEKERDGHPIVNVIAETPPFFRDHKLTIAPHNIYEAKVQVSTKQKNLLEYNFVVSGNSLNGGFTYRSSDFVISGWSRGFASYPNRYFTLPPHPGQCWARISSDFVPRCP